MKKVLAISLTVLILALAASSVMADPADLHGNVYYQLGSAQDNQWGLDLNVQLTDCLIGGIENTSSPGIMTYAVYAKIAINKGLSLKLARWETQFDHSDSLSVDVPDLHPIGATGQSSNTTNQDFGFYAKISYEF